MRQDRTKIYVLEGRGGGGGFYFAEIKDIASINNTVVCNKHDVFSGRLEWSYCLRYISFTLKIIQNSKDA
jgi:hypothetical protein